MGSANTDVMVVGAGPYGLSVAAHLLARGTEVRVVGRPMSSWIDNMPAGMLLKSEGFASSLSDPAGALSLEQYAREHGVEYRDVGLPVDLDTFSQYGLTFQRRHVPSLEDTQVLELRRDDRGFGLTLGTGERLTARRVVLAIGHAHFAYVPPCFDTLSEDHVSHTSQHRDLSRFRGMDVTVVGAGQSALETAALAHENGAHVRLLARCRALAWNENPNPHTRTLRDRVRCPTAALCVCGWRCLLYSYGSGVFHHFPLGWRTRTVRSTFGPAGAWWLKPRVEERFDIRLGCAVTEASRRNGRVRLRTAGPGGEDTVETEHVIAGTGYRVDVDALSFLDRELAAAVRCAAGTPKLSRSFESSLPGLYFVGLAAANEFGPSMRFVHGADFTAHRLARHLASSARAPSLRATLAGAGPPTGSAPL
jgi:thioredoxin reductase